MKQEIIWMPHPAHFIGSHNCEFRLATYVNGYIVSTVGEYALYGKYPTVGESKYLKKIYGKKIYSSLGNMDEFYETMVFNAAKNTKEESQCCLYIVEDLNPIVTIHYKTNIEAYNGHMKYIKEYENK